MRTGILFETFSEGSEGSEWFNGLKYAEDQASLYGISCVFDKADRGEFFDFMANDFEDGVKDYINHYRMITSVRSSLMGSSGASSSLEGNEK